MEGGDVSVDFEDGVGVIGDCKGGEDVFSDGEGCGGVGDVLWEDGGFIDGSFCDCGLFVEDRKTGIGGW